MESVEERLKKLREQRIARQNARIEKLRELNLKKYNPPQNHQSKPTIKNNIQIRNGLGKVNSTSNVNSTSRVSTAPVSKVSQHGKKLSPVKDIQTLVKVEAKTNNVIKTSRVSLIPKVRDDKNVKGTSEKVLVKSLSLPTQSNEVVNSQDQTGPAKTDQTAKADNLPASAKLPVKTDIIKSQPSTSSRILTEIIDRGDAKRNLSKFALENSMRKSLAAPISKTDKPAPSRKSMLPKINTNKESVFDRLYKPKVNHSIKENKVEKIQKDPSYLKKVIKTAGLILPLNEPNKVRRSISAVHFKRLNKDEINNCIHKWSSVSEKLNKIDDEDDMITETEDKVISAVKSERKKVKFMTPTCLNTPRPEELQQRLKNWLQKRGKSLDSYHHLQCFGLHHLSKKFDHYDEENKENIAVETDSDDGSYSEIMNEDKKLVDSVKDFDKWRRVSSVSESVDFNESRQFNDTLTSTETGVTDANDIVMGALSDLAELLREGFDWRQTARWLRAIRDRFPQVTSTASYWECRAALEERRGDLPASVHCWEEAIAKGIGHSVVEANLDQLLDKFMQLKISPNSGAEKCPDPKLVDVKNVFKSTIIKFAVSQAKLRQSQTPIVTVTPVRRSGRLSFCPSSQRVCDNMRQIKQIAPEHQFTPNRNLVESP